MRFLLCAGVLAMLATQGWALSCVPHDVAFVYQEADRSEDRYVVVLGRLEFDSAALPRRDLSGQEDTPPDTLIPARVDGRAMGRAGFTVPFEAEITLNAQCFGPWCAGAMSGVAYLSFLQTTPDGYLLRLDPCGGMGFAEPTPDAVAQVLACFRGEACIPAHLR